MKVHVKSKLPEKPTSDDVVNLILKNRNIGVGSDSFFNPPHPSSLSLSDFGFGDKYIKEAIDFVWSLNESPKPIIVYSDYDADGITGGAILWETLHTLGFKTFPYIGNRVEEGYGFSKLGLDMIQKKYDPGLIISVDHGISAKEMVEYALSELQIPTIVTDHHHRQEEKVPTSAKAIFHIPTLSGSGTAYYVAKEIASRPGTRDPSFAKGFPLRSKSFEGQVGWARQGSVISGQKNTNTVFTDDCRLKTDNSLPDLFASDFVGLAAIGTIADLVPLIGPSRAIAKHGLEAISKTKRPGLEALKKASGNLGKTITTYEVGFMLAPRINASGRLSDALTALRLLCTKDNTKADTIASHLESLNRERQDLVKKAVIEATDIVEKMRGKNGELPKILLVHQPVSRQNITQTVSTDNRLLTTDNSPQPPPWNEGIIGLIASKLVEKYHRPVIVFTKNDTPRGRASMHLSSRAKSRDPSIPVAGGRDDGAGVGASTQKKINGYIYKASARSIPGFHLTDFLKNFQNILSHFGGHAGAAGLSISEANLPAFIAKAVQLADELISKDMLEPTVEVDCELPISLAGHNLAQQIETLAPFGMGNPRPIFKSSGNIEDVSIIGKDKKHARFKLVQDNCSLDFIAFGKAQDVSAQARGTCSPDRRAEVTYTLDLNVWNGNTKVQAKLSHLI